MTRNTIVNEIIYGLGYKFWITVVSEHGVKEINHCLTMIKHLQGHLSDIIPTSEDKEELSVIDNADEIFAYEENKEAFILCIGFKFWMKTVRLHQIDDIKHCSVTLKYLQGFLKDYQNQNQGQTQTQSKDGLELGNIMIPDRKRVVGIISEEFKDDDKKVNIDLENVVEYDSLIEEKKRKLSSLIKKANSYKNIEYYDDSKIYDGRRVIVKCDYCDKIFPSVYTASLHTDIAHAEKKEDFDKRYKKYNCVRESCGNSFYSMLALDKHCDRFHKEDKYQIRSELKIHFAKNIDEPEICPHCGVKLSSQKLKKHIRYHQQTLKEKKEINLRCQYCQFLADTQGYLTAHMFKEHDHGAIFCVICGVKCKGRHKINDHMD